VSPEVSESRADASGWSVNPQSIGKRLPGRERRGAVPIQIGIRSDDLASTTKSRSLLHGTIIMPHFFQKQGNEASILKTVRLYGVRRKSALFRRAWHCMMNIRRL